MDQWTSYGWNVLSIPDGHDYDQIVRVLRDMEEWDPRDRRPMIVFGKTIKGYWPGAVNGKLPGADQIVGVPSPYAFKMNSSNFVALAETFEQRRVKFAGIRDGPVTDRASGDPVQDDIDVAMSVLDRNGLGEWLADRLVEIGDSLRDDLRAPHDVGATLPGRAAPVANLPEEPQTLSVKNPISGRRSRSRSRRFRKYGEVAGARRGISELSSG
jgi:hypothetical protein